MSVRVAGGWKVGVAWSDTFFVSDGSGTAVTGLTTSSFTRTLYADKAVSTQPVTITEIGSGLYYATFTPNTPGDWFLRLDHATYGMWTGNVQVTARTNDDYAYGLSLTPNGRVQADVEEWAGDTVSPLIFGRPDVSVGDMQSGVITTTSYGTGASASGLTSAQVSAAVWDEATASHTTASTFGKLLGTLTFNGTNVKSDIQTWLGSAPNALQSGRVDSYLGAVASGVISASSFAANALGAVWDELRSSHTTSGTFGELGVSIIRTGTCQAGSTGSTIVLDAGASSTNDFYTFMLVTIKSGTGAGLSQFISAYNGTTKTATVSPGWITTPDNTSVFVILSTSIQGVDWNVIANPSVSKSLSNTSIGSVIGSVGSVTGNVGGNVVGSVASVTGNVGGNVVGSVGSVTGNVGGNVVGSVGSVTAGVTVTTNNDKTGYALSSAGVQAIWDKATSALTTVGSIGKLLVDNIDATISSRLASASYTSPPSAATIATAVWNETIATWSGASGKLGQACGYVLSVANDVWEQPKSAHTTVGSMGELVDAKTSTRAAPSDILTTPANKLATDINGFVSVAAVASNAIDSTSVTAAYLAAVAKQTLIQSISGTVEAVAGRYSLGGAIAKLVNKVTLTPSTLTVYKTDGVTTNYTQTVTEDPTANPVSSLA